MLTSTNFIKDFSLNRENTMLGPLNASILSSVSNLNKRYVFINPQQENAEADLDELQNSLIAVIHDYVDKLINRLYLIRLEPENSIAITDKTREILANETHPKYSRALFALDVMAAATTFIPRNSVNLNTPIFLYGNTDCTLNYIMLMFWHCCLENIKSNGAGLMPGVRKRDAVRAMIRGIAEGSRGHNRDSGHDDLRQENFPCCVLGRNSRLVTAFIGIFPEINIIYDIIDSFLDHIKKQIISEIVATAQDLSEANKLLDIWLGLDLNKPPKEFDLLKFNLIKKQPLLISSFVLLTSGKNTTLGALIHEELAHRINEIEQTGHGLSLIELTSPSRCDLQQKWNEINPKRKQNQKPSDAGKRQRLTT